MKSLAHSIARVAHEVNAAYCRSLGDYTQPAWENAPEWQQKSAIAGAELHLSDPSLSASASHAAWMATKVAEGWVYGPEKDAEKKTHPCLVPFDELPPEQRAKDFIFQGGVHAIAREMAR